MVVDCLVWTFFFFFCLGFQISISFHPDSLWSNILGYYLLFWHPMWAQDQVLAVALSIQFAIKVPRKAAERGLTYWTPAPTWKKCLAPDFSCDHALVCYKGHGPVDGNLSLSPSLPHSDLSVLPFYLSLTHSFSLQVSFSNTKIIKEKSNYVSLPTYPKTSPSSIT